MGNTDDSGTEGVLGSLSGAWRPERSPAEPGAVLERPSRPQEAPSVPRVPSEGYLRKMQQKDSRAETERHWQRRMKAGPVPGW